ncbi:MAG TPA: glycosyl hydrolase [Longimicrobiaceae bacterium]|nr:glycosyl hydrolase [Longimicrobiaceae bacterium]
MIEAVMVWNEPNNQSHWDFHVDKDWKIFSAMARKAGEAVAAEDPRMTRVLGGISPIDPHFIRRMSNEGVLAEMDVVAVHGFPLDWNLWGIEEWPDKLAEIRSATDLPLWVTEVGVSTFANQAVQALGLRQTAELLLGRSERIHWYSLFDLPRAWDATTRHGRAEGSSYHRHFYMGLIDEHGAPKQAVREFAELTPDLGICQWFHFEDPRLDDAVRWMRELGVTHLRTGLSWSDDEHPRSDEWFDRQMRALEEFEVTLTFCFTPESRGILPHYTSPPQRIEEYADFCARMTRRYATGAVGA